MRRKWVITSGGGHPAAVIMNLIGYAVVVHIFPDGCWYGLVPRGPHNVIVSGSSQGWSLKKAKRKALKHLFRLRK